MMRSLYNEKQNCYIIAHEEAMLEAYKRIARSYMAAFQDAGCTLDVFLWWTDSKLSLIHIFSHLKGQEALFARWRRFYIAYLWRVGGSYLAIGACLLFSHRAAAMLLGCIAVILDELLTTYVRFLYKGGFITGVCKYAIKESQYKRRH